CVTGVRKGALTIRVRHFGYQPMTIDVTIGTEERASTTIALEPTAETLDTVTTLDSAGAPDSHLTGFYARKSANSFARFFDHDDIERRRPQFMSEMLRAVPGVTLAPSSRSGYAVRIRGCAPLVWLDGVRLPGAQLDDVVRPGDVAGIEI